MSTSDTNTHRRYFAEGGRVYLAQDGDRFLVPASDAAAALNAAEDEDAPNAACGDVCPYPRGHVYCEHIEGEGYRNGYDDGARAAYSAVGDVLDRGAPTTTRDPIAEQAARVAESLTPNERRLLDMRKAELDAQAPKSPRGCIDCDCWCDVCTTGVSDADSGARSEVESNG